MGKYGTILNVYDITVTDNEKVHTGEITFKLKMTEEMKKYNTFRLVCIDGDTIKDNDIAVLKQEGEYLVGNLYHLSNYALVCDNVESTTTDVAQETTTSSNPKTGDNIITLISMFAVSTLGACTILIFNKKTKTIKH